MRYVAVTISILLLANAAHAADVTSTWDGTANNWTSNHWSSPNFPNNGNGGLTYDAIIGSGTVTLDQDIAVQKLTLGGGTLTATSNFGLTINDLLTWTVGTMSGAGQTTIAPGASLAISSGVQNVPNALNRSLVNNGTATWTVSNSGTLNMNGGTITNNGSFIASSGSSSLTLNSNSGTNLFTNVGSFTKLGAGSTAINVPLINSGTVDVQGGILSLVSSANHTGDFTIAASTVLAFQNTHNFSATSDFTNAGTLSLNGTTTFDGPRTIGGTLNSSGTTTFNDTTSIVGLNLTGTLTGPGNVTLTGPATWTVGTMSGAGQTTIAPGASLAISSGVQNVPNALNRSLVNNGTATWTVSNSGTLNMNGGTITNNGSFIASSGSSSLTLNSNSGTNLFTNVGSFTKLGAGSTAINVPLINSGTVDVQGGILSLVSSANHTGEFTIAASTVLAFQNTHGFSATSDFTNAGTLSLNGTTTFDGPRTIGGTLNSSGTTTFNDTTSIAGLNLTGTLTGPGNVTLTGPATWTFGTMSGAGQTTIAPGASLAISSGVQNVPNALNRSLVNNGTATWTVSNSGTLNMNGGTITNNSNFIASSGSSSLTLNSTSGTNLFDNAGTFTKLGAGQAAIAVPLNNSGTVDIQQGLLSLSGGGTNSGSFSIASGATFQPGTYTFDSNSLISGAGTMNINSTVTVAGDTSVNGITTNLNSGSLIGAGNLTIQTGQLAWTFGTMSGAGQTIIGAGASLSMSSASAVVPNALNRMLINNGTATWTVGGGSTLTMNGGTITNNGSFIANPGNGTLSLNPNGGTNVFNNAGTLTKLGTGTVTLSAGVTFTNTGAVNVQAGRLNLRTGATHTGDFTVPSGAELLFGDGTQIRGGETVVEHGASLFTQSGPLYFGATSETTLATLTNFGTINSSVVIEGAKLNGAGSITGNLTLRGATVKNTQYADGHTDNIEVLGDLIIEAPGVGLAEQTGSILIGDTISVHGTTHVRSTFTLQSGVFIGSPDNTGQLIIEDGGTVETGTNRLGSSTQKINVIVKDGGILDSSGPIVGSIVIDGGQVKHNPKPDKVKVTKDSTNTGSINAGTIAIDENSKLGGHGNINVSETMGGGESDNDTTLGPLQIPEDSGAGGAVEIGQIAIGPGNGVGKLTFTSPASAAFKIQMPNDPSNGKFEFEINNATGAAGQNPGWDMLLISNGGVTLEGNAGSGMTVAVKSLLGNSAGGALANFNPATHFVWRFIDTALGFSGVPIASLNLLVDDSLFAAINGIPSGRFSVIQDTPHSLALSFAELIPGDYDGNDVVDAADYALWKTTFGSTVDRRADGNRNGIVDAADYTIWSDHLGSIASGSGGVSGRSQNVPEPAGYFLLCSGVISLVARRRFHNRPHRNAPIRQRTCR